MFQSVLESKTYLARPVDAKGNDAKVDGVPSWALTDPSLADLKVAADGLSCEVIPLGAPGICKLQVVGDADLSAEVKEIFGEADIEFVAAEAVRFDISAQA